MEKRLLEHTAGDLCNGSTESFGQSDERNPFCPRRRKPNSPPEKSPDKDGESRCPYCCSPNAAWIPISTASPRNRRSIGQTGPNGFCSPGTRKTWGEKPPATYPGGRSGGPRTRSSWRTRWKGSGAWGAGGFERGGREVRQASWIGGEEELVKSRYGRAEAPQRARQEEEGIELSSHFLIIYPGTGLSIT